MAILIDKQSGKPVNVLAQDVQPALASGQYQIPTDEGSFKDGKIRVMSPEGEAGLLPPENLMAALEAGYRLREPEDEHSGAVGAMKGFGVGLARGLTLGLAQPMLEGVGVDADAIQRANPGASGVGEVLGIVGGLLVPEGKGVGTGAKALGTVGKLGRAAEVAGDVTRKAAFLPRAVESLGSATANRVEGMVIKALTGGADAGIAKRALSKAIGTAAQGSVEGMIWQAGQVISEEDLGDPKAVAEALVAQVGPAALWGGVAGGLFGGGSALAGETFRALSNTAGKRLSDWASSTKGQAKLADFSEEATYKALGLTPAQVDRLPEEALNVLHDPSILPDGAIIQPKLSQKEVVGRLRQAGKKAGDDIGRLYDEVDAQVASKTADGVFLTADDIVDGLSDVEGKLVDQFGDQSDAVKAVRQFFNKVSGESVFSATEMKGLWTQIKAFGSRRLQPGSFEWGMRDVWHMLKDATRSRIDEIDPELASRLARADEVYRNTLGIRVFAKKVAKGAGADDVNTLFRRAGEVASWRTASAVGSMLKGAGPGAVLGGIAGGIPGAVMGAGGSVLLQKLRPEASTIANVANKAAHLGLIQQKVLEYQKRIDKGVDTFIKRASHKPTSLAAPLAAHVLYESTGEKDTRKAARKLAMQLQQLGNNPQALIDNLTVAAVGMEHSPVVQQQLAQTMSTAFSVARRHSDGVMPPPDMLQPLLDDENQLPSKEAADRFARVVATVLNPEVALQHLADGTITAQEVSVLKEVYPALYGMISIQLMDRMSQLKERVPYETRVALSLWLNRPTDRTLTPDFIRRSQQTYAQHPAAKATTSPKQGGLGGPAGVRAKGLQRSENAATLAQTTTQRIGRELG